jgi:hypothetical protein
VRVAVPRSVVIATFKSRKDFDIGNVNQGLLGLGSVVGNGDTYVFSISLAKIIAEGGRSVDPETFDKRLHENHLFSQEQAHHGAAWSALQGIDVEDACPENFREARAARVNGACLDAVDRLRGAWAGAPNADATKATRTSHFSLAFDKNSSNSFRDLKGRTLWIRDQHSGVGIDLCR